MKRFILFAGHHYYPNGGVNDFHGSFDTITDAKNWAAENIEKISGSSYIDNWCHIVVRDTFEIISMFEQDSRGNVGIGE
jgi:hypothetical protein